MQPGETFRTPWSAKDRGAQWATIPEFDNQTASGMAE